MDEESLAVKLLLFVVLAEQQILCFSSFYIITPFVYIVYVTHDGLFLFYAAIHLGWDQCDAKFEKKIINNSP